MTLLYAKRNRCPAIRVVLECGVLFQGCLTQWESEFGVDATGLNLLNDDELITFIMAWALDNLVHCQIYSNLAFQQLMS